MESSSKSLINGFTYSVLVCIIDKLGISVSFLSLLLDTYNGVVLATTTIIRLFHSPSGHFITNVFYFFLSYTLILLFSHPQVMRPQVLH